MNSDTSRLNEDSHKLQVRSPENTYPIWVGEGLLQQVGEALANLDLAETDVGVITHPRLAQLYGETLQNSLQKAGYKPHLFTFPAGETSKVLGTVKNMYKACIEAQLDRRSTIVALGGGVITDVAGFVAATYLRGVPYFPVPSTLLSMVDSSVGAKSGVDLPQGKNLVGAFKQPEGVVIDPQLLDSLPRADLVSGMAEVIKHAIVSDIELFALLEEQGIEQRSLVLTRAIQVKIDIVEEDPYERGRRSVLNLGHTFAHAIEQVSDFRVRHGEAVGIGMAAAANMSVALGRCSQATADRIENLIQKTGLPTRIGDVPHVDETLFDPEMLYAAMSTDKKRSGTNLRFVVIDDFESVQIIDHPGDSYVLDAWYYSLK